MTEAARLIDVAVPKRPAAVVIVLHGGASRGGTTRVSPTQLSVLRMIPVARRVARASDGHLAVVRLLNSHRGWDQQRTPLQDVRWALAETARRVGPQTPVVLVGHSLGGRAALLAAGDPQVRGAVALAPWLYAADGSTDIRETPIVIIHGDADRVADPERSAQVARQLGRHTPVAYVDVRGGTHSMLRRAGAFDRLAAVCAVWMALGEVTGPTVRRIAEGERRLEV